MRVISISQKVQTALNTLLQMLFFLLVALYDVKERRYPIYGNLRYPAVDVTCLLFKPVYEGEHEQKVGLRGEN